MPTHTDTKTQRVRRHKRVRSVVRGTAARPRLAVFRSNRALFAQIIDDEAGATLLAVRSSGTGPKREQAAALGAEIAQRASTDGITSVVFDRGGFQYTGAIKVAADAAREGGLIF